VLYWFSMEELRLTTLVEVLAAAAHTWAVEWPGFPQQGGIFLGAPPGQLKTFMIMALENVPGTKGVSDLTSRELDKLHARIESKEIRTLLFFELPKIYERRLDTASNIMGHIRSLVDEGFTGVSSSQAGIRSRCTVIAAMPLKFQRAHEAEWDDNGLSRRMIFSRFILKHPEVIERAIVTGTKIKTRMSFPVPLDPIRMSVTHEEGKELLLILKRGEQSSSTPFVLLKKIVSVLRWKAKELHRRDDSMETIREFAKSMGRSGAEVEIDL
jgi:hypothetical protein